MENIPQKIFLQVDPDNEEPEDFNDVPEITWSEDHLNETDIEYVRAIIERSKKIELLEAYSKYLEKNGYMDVDWNTEEPYAIDEFLALKK